MTHFDRKVRSDRLEGDFGTCAFDTKPFSKLSSVDIVDVCHVGSFRCRSSEDLRDTLSEIPDEGTQA